MRTIRKRLTCVNRGNIDKNEIAMSRIVERYIEKMNKKRWILSEIYTGDCFLKFEAIVYMTKKNYVSI